jgi:hypothetical protein
MQSLTAALPWQRGQTERSTIGAGTFLAGIVTFQRFANRMIRLLVTLHLRREGADIVTGGATPFGNRFSNLGAVQVGTRADRMNDISDRRCDSGLYQLFYPCL